MAHKTQSRPDTERTVRATEDVQAIELPKQGEIYRCNECGMELKITSDCHCADPNDVKLECCGKELLRV